MRITPLYDNLVIRPRVNSPVTKSGFLIPDIAKASNPFKFGEVLEVGTGRVNAEGKVVPLVCKAGDVVCYAKGAGTEIPMEHENGEEVVLLLPERYVMGIVHDLPTQTVIQGIDGRLLSMMPSSRAMPDSAAKNREDLERAERSGFVDPTEHPPDEPNNMTG